MMNVNQSVTLSILSHIHFLSGIAGDDIYGGEYTCVMY